MSNFIKSLFGGSSKKSKTSENAAPAMQARPAVGASSTGVQDLIQKLSLKPRELEFFHPEKEKALTELQRLGSAATEPLLAALDNGDAEAKGSIISLLGRSKDRRAILPIARQLQQVNPQVKYEAATALAAYPLSDLREAGILDHLKPASSDADIEVRKQVTALLDRLGTPVPDSPWFTGARTWEQLAKAFIRLELPKPAPDYAGLAEKTQNFGAAERHAVWIRVAQELKNKTDKLRCYLEALHHDPDPASVAWDWLNGHYDPAMNILADRPKTRETVEELRRQHRPMVEA